MPPNLQSRRRAFPTFLRAAFWIKLHVAFAPMLLVAFSFCNAAQSVKLAWDASPSPGVSGYKIYYGTSSGSPGPPRDVGNVTSATISDLNDSTQYFFSVTAYYDPSGLESQRSNEVSYKTPERKYLLTVNSGTGSGPYPYAAKVPVSAYPPEPGQQFAVWDGDRDILANFTSPNTTATIIRMDDLAITATYKVSDRIRYYPRSGYRQRMVGGVFEGTNDSLTGYTQIHKITATPPLAWTAVNANLGNYRYLRYRGPNGSYGNVAEIEFYRDGVKVTGTGYGTKGSYGNRGATSSKALDGSISTYFDGPTPNGNYVGIITTQ